MDGVVNQQSVLPLRVLLLGKSNSDDCERVLDYCRQSFAEVTYCDGQWGDPLPRAARAWEGDLIISYLCRWVIPAEILARARIAAINFHPATPEYPGIGCNNFALYEGASTYGATCHHMVARVDAGQVIAVTRFPISEAETVASLLKQTYRAMLDLFVAVMNEFRKNLQFPKSDEHWTRAPFTREQFNALCNLDAGMSPDELKKRVRATLFPPWGPSLNLHGFRFKLAPEGEA